MNSSQANSQEYQRQAIDAEIRSLEESICALRLRRNALAPISSLPPEIIAAIFSFSHLPRPSSQASQASPFTLGERPDPLAWLHVAHVCHQWREIALNQPLFWSHVDFTTLTSTGAAKMLARAKTVPLYLEARVPIGHWDDSRFSAFRKEVRARISHICHLGISAEHSHLRRTVEGLTSPAPTLESLSLSGEEDQNGAIGERLFVPDTLFDGTTPRLSCLVLRNCDISWESPLLRGLKHLEIRTPSEKPGLSVWLDALGEMPQLKTLVLHSASPIAPSIPFDVEHTVTLPSATRLDISASADDCALALAHLILPALTWLCLTVRSRYPDGSDVQKLIPYVVRHAHGPQDTRPLQSALIRGDMKRADILAWPMPDIDVKVHDPLTLLAATHSARVMLSVEECFNFGVHIDVLDEAIACLPLDGLVTLTAQRRIQLDEEFWLRHAPRWPLLQRVQLVPPAARGFREMLLRDYSSRECPLFPSLTKLDLIDDSALSARRTLRLCDALMKRVEQGVPLETLNLRTCLATNRAVQLLSEIVVDVWGPTEALETSAQKFSTWDSGARGLFVHDEDSGAEDYGGDGSNTDGDDGEGGVWGVDSDEDENDEEADWEAEYIWEMMDEN